MDAKNIYQQLIGSGVLEDIIERSEQANVSREEIDERAKVTHMMLMGIEQFVEQSKSNWPASKTNNLAESMLAKLKDAAFNANKVTYCYDFILDAYKNGRTVKTFTTDEDKAFAEACSDKLEEYAESKQNDAFQDYLGQIMTTHNSKNKAIGKVINRWKHKMLKYDGTIRDAVTDD